MKVEIGIISGSGAYDMGVPVKEDFTVETPYGSPSSDVHVLEMGGNTAAFIQRHGPRHTIPPHMINHRANIYALSTLGVTSIVSIGSVGSLKAGLKPPAIVIPEDYISPFRSDTFFDSEVRHITPEINEEVRRKLKEAAEKEGMDVHYGGVYIQTLGPRLETKAEIRMYSRFADVVGMTLGSEAVLSQELGMGFAALCSVDNYAHGIGGEVPEFRQILANAERNHERTKAIVRRFVESSL